MDAHVVAHTHWDREWYHPVERFRQRLVALVDELIDDPPRGNESFLLDGQTIVLDDYLAVRPDRAAALFQLLRDGRLEAGPWCVLADELIASGEALVRNLLAGRRTLRRIGVESPPVLYCPDSFGHPAALPSIAAGFGLPLIILWRGYGGARWPHGDVVRWIAPGGDEALIYHLPRDGYEFGSHLPLDADGASARWQRMRDELQPRSTTGVELIPNGADHHARQLGQRDAVAALAVAAAPDVVHPSSLRAFSDSVVAAARALDRPLPVVHGELRDSYGYTWTLQGTFATRAHEKRMNARAERLLLRDTEPWAAMAARLGASKRPLVDAAWRTLLEAHPHDTLCGCSIDEVAEAMELRIRSATNQAVGIREDAVARLVGHDAVEARTAKERWTPTILVRNPSPRPRGGIVMVEIEQFGIDVAVGPGSTPPTTFPKAEHSFPLSGLDLIQIFGEDLEQRLTESPRHYPDNDLVGIMRIAVWVPTVPSYGIVPLTTTRMKRALATARERELENASYRITVDEAGGVVVEHKLSDRRIASLLELVTEADAGDSYTPAPRPPSYRIDFDGFGCGRPGPLIASLVLRYKIFVVASPAPDVSKHQVARAAMPDHIEFHPCTIELRISLEGDASWIGLEIDGVNRLEDHRLRLRIRSDVPSADVWADAAFGPVRRTPLDIPPSDATAEIPPPTAPLHRYVSRFDDARGCTVFSDGLAEYETVDDGSILVTLLRAIGDLSVNDLPERPGNAGWPKRIPGAQCLGPFGAKVAFMLHGARTPETIDAIERAVDDFLLPLYGTTLRSALRVPDAVVGVELRGVGLALSSIKESEDGRWLVLRCVNLVDAPVAGAWALPFDVVQCLRARLDETPIEELSSTARLVAFEAQSREIVTLLVR